MPITDLPHVNVTLNSLSAVLLTAGYIAIRGKRIAVHRGLMIAAMISAALFLISYLVYHFNVPSRPYTGTGWRRPVYFAILLSHVILAMVNLPMVIITAVHALRQRFDRHRRIARWTLPIWWYVSVTGIIVYVMLYTGTNASTRRPGESTPVVFHLPEPDKQ